nr:hypothetical protein [Candidatus Sigynarchaeota archaeon]
MATPPLKVADIAEEYEFVDHQSCSKCSAKGTFIVLGQSLVKIGNTPHDVLHVRCSSCGNEQDFSFDVTIVFAQYDEMLGLKDAKK